MRFWDGRRPRIAEVLGGSAFPRQILPDAEPQISVSGLRAGYGIVCDGDARDFDDTGLDGIDEREIGDDPGEESAFPVA